ncbi:MAG TPA: hypothetical protein VGE74_12960 [Gemmata sp.]
MTGLELIEHALAVLDPDGTLRLPEAQKAGVTLPPSSSPRPLAGGADPVERARKWIARGPGSISGQGGHNRAFEVAQALVNGFELSPSVALGLMLTDFNPKCQPEWSERELEHKIEEAESKPCSKARGWLLNATLDRMPHPSSFPDRPPAPGESVGHPAPLPGPSSAPSAPLGLPRIVQQPAQLRDVVDQALAALVKANDPIATFIHGDTLVRIDTTQQNAAVKSLSKAQLRLLLSNSANWVNVTTNKDGEEIPKATFPKAEVVESIQDHTAWPGIPRLTAVADVPVITAESGLLTKPGYDAASGVYLLPGGYADVPHVSDAPTAQDVEIARSLLLDELLGDFPFVDAASKANVLALFLLPFVRGLIDGPTPLHHVDAPQEGTGKSLLIQTWGWVTLGREPKALGEVSRPDDWQKLILAALMEAPREIFLDNLNQNLDSGSLASALTSTVIGGRLLGFSRMVSAPVNCVWVSSGNNVGMSRELVRRTLCIRLDARQDAAWKDRQFKYKLPKWAQLKRGELVWCCLTICQAWVAAGKPPGRSVIGGYESWSAVMDGILSNAGIRDLAGNADDFRAISVDSGDEWRVFVPEWWREFGSNKVTSGELVRLADQREMLVSLLEQAKNDRSRGTVLGKQLKKVRDRVYRGLRIEFAGTYQGQSQYRLSNLEPDAQEPEQTEVVSGL